MNNIEVFLDTQKRITNNARLKRLTEKASSETKIYPEGFQSGKKPFRAGNICFQENLTLLAAAPFAKRDRRTAVLNFANPFEPGGGVLRGANAQEEYLCRASNLYNCLVSKNASEWYSVHKEMAGERLGSSFIGTDRIVYSSGVTVFKKDVGYLPEKECNSFQKYTFRHFRIDVITSAAPFFISKYDLLPEDELQKLFVRRITNIIEIAVDNDVTSLILGAFGCGAFNNPPEVVAEAFRKVFSVERYRYAFDNVVFAVRRTGVNCKNIEAFKSAFSDFI